ncbi:hypothetical protein [Solibacillus cecembensis]|uniref:hypothetical protein n=1 Tax=Solibacillus cecembensis TaxID=459347 RepID=UPI003D060F95
MNRPYNFLENDINGFIDEFFTEYKYMEKKYTIENDMYYDFKIEEIKSKYTKKERKFLLKQLREQYKINSNWYARQIAIVAMLVAIATAFTNSNVEFLKIMSYFIYLYIPIYLIYMDKKFVIKNNRILKVITIFQFIENFDKK